MASAAEGKAGGSWGGWKGSASYCIWQYSSSTSTCIQSFCQTTSPSFFLVQLHLPKCRWTGNIVDWNFLKFSSEINMLQSYLKGPDFQSWATPTEVRGLKVSPTESLRCEPLSEVCGFNPPPFTVRPLLWELGILQSLWSWLFANVSSCSFAHMTPLVLPVSLPFWTVGSIWWKLQTHQPKREDWHTLFSGSG